MSTVTFFITYVTTCYVSHTTVVSLIHSSKISTMKVQHQLKLRQNWNVDMWVHFPGNKNIEIRELLVMEPVSLVIRLTHTHTHPFNGPLSRTTLVGRYQKGKTNLDFTEARDSECQWHQLGHMQVCTSLQTDNHTSNPPLSFYRPDALPAAQPTASKH